MRRLFFFVLFVGLLGGGAYLFLLGQPTPAPEEADTVEAAKAPPARLRMEGLIMRQVEGERIAWELWAAEALYTKEGQPADLRDVRFRAYDKAAIPTVEMQGRSERAVLHPERDTLLMERGVRLERAGGIVITGERLEYEGAGRVITSPTTVQITHPRGTQQGASMRYEVDTQRLTLTEPLLLQ